MTEIQCPPADPAMARNDPAMFAPMTADQHSILGAHLTSGWYKQSAVYPLLSEPWRETAVILRDLHLAHQATYKPGPDAEPEAAA